MGFQYAFKLQSEILEQNRESNKISHEAIAEALRNGETVTSTGSMTGPYTQTVTYFMSNGKAYTVVMAASLGWAINVIEPF